MVGAGWSPVFMPSPPLLLLPADAGPDDGKRTDARALTAFDVDAAAETIGGFRWKGR
jgi:hypothetical protein